MVQVVATLVGNPAATSSAMVAVNVMEQGVQVLSAELVPSVVIVEMPS